MKPTKSVHSSENLNSQDRFRELFTSIVKLQLKSVKQIYTIRRNVKTIQQSIKQFSGNS